MEKYQRIALKNGLRVLTIPMPQVKSATVTVLIGAGSRYENEKISGLSHFLEHMAFKGTKKRPTALQIASEIDSIGGEFNAFTSKDHTGYYVKAASKHLPLCLDILADMILNSKFEKHEIEKEKGVILEEINMREDMPIYRVDELFEELIYQGFALGRKIIGQKEMIKKIKRADFLNYVKSLYSPDNSVVIIAGGINQSSHPPAGKASQQINQVTNQLIPKSLSNWQKHPTWQLEKVSAKQQKPQVKLEYKRTEQAHLCLGVHALSLTHPDRYILSVLSTILGGGMSSRLFTEVREKRGLAYYIRSSTNRYIDVGNFVTQAGIDLKRIDEAIKVISEQYYNLIQVKPVLGRQELTKAKEYLKGHLILELEDSKAVALLYGIQELLEKKVKTPEEIIKAIDKVTVEDIHRVAAKIFRKENLNLAIIGPFKDRQRFERLLES